MFTRRDFVTATAAAALLTGSGRLAGAAAQQKLSQQDLLRFEPLGQVTLINFTDIHAQLRPIYFREPSVNLGVGAAKGLPPHITGKAFLDKYGLKPGSAAAYALTSEDFTALARAYGRMGGLDRIATIVKAIRAERPGKTLLLDGGDTWQGDYVSLKTRGANMVEAMNALGVDAMTAHWEFTYGADRVKELIERVKFPFLAANVRDTEWSEDVFKSTKYFTRGGVTVAVIGQAFPFTPIANPRYLISKWSFGIREKSLRQRVAAARKRADLVVLLSHNGFDVDRKLAARIPDLDVILTGHTHDALPDVVTVGKTLLVASGSHGKFVARLDLDVKGKRVVGHRFRLIPVFSDVIQPDPAMAALIDRQRKPHRAEIERVVGKTKSLLYRRGNFNGTFDDVICRALLEERDAEVALSPGFRWGSSILPGQDITVEHVYHQTAVTYPNAYRTKMKGSFLKTVLEDVADNLFNPDPYYQQGGDMVRVGGIGFRIDVNRKIGQRISNLTLLRTGKPIDPDRDYVVAGWASVNPGTQGPPIYDVLTRYIERHKEVDATPGRRDRRGRGLSRERGAGGARRQLSGRVPRGAAELPVALYPADRAALSGLPGRHHARPGVGRRRAHRLGGGAAHLLCGDRLRARLHDGLRRARRDRVGDRRVRRREQGAARPDRRRHHHRHGHPLPRHPAHPVPLSGGAGPGREAAGGSDRRLHRRARLRLRLDAVRRSGADGRAVRGRRQGYGVGGGVAAGRLRVRDRAAVPGGGVVRGAVPALHGALPALHPLGRARAGRAADRHRRGLHHRFGGRRLQLDPRDLPGAGTPGVTAGAGAAQPNFR